MTKSFNVFMQHRGELLPMGTVQADNILQAISNARSPAIKWPIIEDPKPVSETEVSEFYP